MDLFTLTLIGTIATIILVLLAISQRAGVSPKLLVRIDYVPGNEPLEVQNVEGQVAYNVRLDTFMTDIPFGEEAERFYCKFETINHLPVGQSARLLGLLEDSRGEHEISRMALEAIRARSGFATGLALRLHYKDGAGTRYVVHVRMPAAMLMSAHLDQPTCSPPIPITWLTAPVEIVRWPLLVASTLIRIRRERRTMDGSSRAP